MWGSYEAFGLNAEVAESILKLIRKGMANDLYPKQILDRIEDAASNMDYQEKRKCIEYAKSAINELLDGTGMERLT